MQNKQILKCNSCYLSKLYRISINSTRLFIIMLISDIYQHAYLLWAHTNRCYRFSSAIDCRAGFHRGAIFAAAETRKLNNLKM